MLVLTGTSGGLASVALETVLERKLLQPSEFRLSSWNGQTKSKRATEAGIEVRRGDLTDPESLIRSFEGADAVFLVSYPSVGEERFALHRAAIDAAKAAGVQHILYSSLTFGGLTGEKSNAQVMFAHIKTVEYLKASGLKWTVIRYPTYNHLWNNFAGFIQVGEKSEARVVIPEDGPNHWASRQDLGEATASILANWRDYENKTVIFTGPELLTISDIVELYRKYTGRKVDLEIVGTEKAIEYHLKKNTLPPEQASFLPNWASWHGALAQGEANFIDPTLEKLLGRKPQTVESMAAVLFEPETNTLDVKDFN